MIKATELFQDHAPPQNIAYLRFNLDTVGENFIYEEAQCLQRYAPIILCGSVGRLTSDISHYCHQEFRDLYKPSWPRFPKACKPAYLRGISAYKSVIDNHNVRLIHAQFLTDAVFCYPLLKRAAVPVVISLRGYDLFTAPAPAYLSKFFPFVAKFIVKSVSMKNELIARGCAPEKIEVIYGGINADKIVFKPRIATASDIRILCAGRFVDKKGHEITLKSFRELLKTNPSAKLTLVGEGPLKEHLVKLSDRLGISAQVRIKDYMPHPLFIRELYRHNLFMLSSRTAKNGDQEGIPNVLKEAMASGMPVISTGHSGIPELITDNETGYLARENDHRGLLAKVHFILNNTEKAFQVALNARFFVEKNFDVKKTAREVERLYDYMLMPDYARSVKDVKEGKRPSSFRVDLHLNKGCNSKCVMCDDWKNNITTSYSREDITKVLDQLRSFGVDHVRFHGQEPTLMKDLFSVMKEAKSRGFRVGLKTNALIFSNEERVKKLDGVLDDLYLSIDAADEHVHNLLRGNKQSFARNMFLAKSIRKINTDAQIYFNAVVTNRNYRYFTGLLDIADQMRVNRVSFVHLSRNNKDDIGHLKLSKEQLEEFYFQIWPRILKKSQDFDIPVGVDPYFTSLMGMSITEQIKKLCLGIEEFSEEIGNFTRGLYGKTFYSKNICHGVLDHATVDWEGNVFPCCAMPRSQGLAIGNLHKNSYDEVWNSAKYVKYRESILRGECQFKDRCSRAFQRTAEYNNYLVRKTETNGHKALEHLQGPTVTNGYTQRYAIEKLVYYSVAKSGMYREKFKGLVDSTHRPDISRLPFTRKEEFKSFFPGKAAVPNYFDEDYGIYRTSSCGSKAFLYARPLQSDIFDRMSASFIQTGGWTRGEPWLKLTSLNCIEAQHPLQKRAGSDRADDRRTSAITVPASDDFIHEPVPEIKKAHDLIVNSEARLIHANPSHLKLLLYRFAQGKMPLPKDYSVHSTYELLLPSTKKLIQKYLDCRVANQYGCSEVGPISFMCRHGNNHIFSDTVHVDVVPADDLKRPDIGRIAVTHLKNYVMPFVKYLNGDFAYVRKNEKCGCGSASPILGDIVGREDEILTYQGKTIFPLELDTLFYNLDNILLYQVILEHDRFLVKFVPEDERKDVSTRPLINGFKRFFEDDDLQIRVEREKLILPKRRGKYASVVVQ